VAGARQRSLSGSQRRADAARRRLDTALAPDQAGFGDLVACPEPAHPERWVVARILAEPGDSIVIEGTHVQINGKPSETEHACPRFKVKRPESGAEVEQDCQLEAVGGSTHLRGSTTGTDVSPAPVTQKVEPGRVFLVSDNRQFPYDSRDFGTVAQDSCSEAVFFRLVGKEGYFDSETRFTYIR